MDKSGIEAFIVAAPRTFTWSELHNAVRQRFGEELAEGWTKDRIALVWASAHPMRRGLTAWYDRDPEVKRFVDDRLFRLTLTEIYDACVKMFGAERAPSRSALHRYSQQVRGETAENPPTITPMPLNAPQTR